MTPLFPIVTAYVAGLIGLLGALLTANVIANRVRANVFAGDGGVPALAQAIRAHGNFAEQAPLALLVLALAESAGARPLVVEIIGVALILSRLSAAYGLNRSTDNSVPRTFGGGTSVLVLAAAALTLLLALFGVH